VAESTLSLTFTQLRRIVGRKYGAGRVPGSFASDDALDVGDFVRTGLMDFYGRHSWGFLQIGHLDIPLYSPYSTGTVAIAAGVVTGTGTTFPSWAADGDLVVAGISYRVSVRGGDTALTLSDTSVAVTAGASYTLLQTRYTLPQSFDHVIGDRMQYRAGDNVFGEIKSTSVDQVRQKRFLDATYADYPRYFSTAPKVSTGSDGQRQEMYFYPVWGSSTQGVALCRYRIHPDMLVDTSLEYPYGGMVHGPAIILACLAQMTLQSGVGADADYQGHYESAVAISKKRDAEAYSPRSVGFDRGIATAFGGDYEDDFNMSGILQGLPDLDIT
jgi:hypothetical protein